MQRVTVTLDEELVAEVDELMHERGYQNRSEAIRDLTRSGLKQVREEAALKQFAAEVTSSRSVRHGQLVLIPDE